MKIATDIHQSIASDINGFGGILRCSVCGNWEWLTDTSGFLGRGWPKCHSYTMSWITNRLIAEEGWELSADGLAWARRDSE